MRIVQYSNSCGKTFLWILLFILGIGGLGASILFLDSPAPPPSKSKTILLHNADILTYSQKNLPDVQKLSGNVKLQHGSWLMYCDSAYLNERTNSFEAFGHIRIKEGDSINITSRSLVYDGVTRMAILRGNVILNNGSSSLFTETLYYDRNQDLAYYDESGTIADSENVLTSVYAEYQTKTGDAYFREEVEIENPDFNLQTNLLYYNTNDHICRIISPTTITSDSTRIETDKGFYNTQDNIGILLNRSNVFHPEGTLTGDSIICDRKAELVEAFGDVEIIGQKKKANFYGDYGFWDQKKEYIFATERSYAIDYSQKDSLFVSADTIEGINTPLPNKEKVYFLKAYKNGKLYRKDMQGVADSITYFSRDSLLSLVGRPILWADSAQLTGDTIRIFGSQDTIKKAQIWNNATSMRSLSTKGLFDQIQSDSIEARWINNQIREAHYIGNVESWFFLEQEKIHYYYAVSHIKNPRMDIFIEKDSLQKVYWRGEAKGHIYPIEQLTPDKQFLGKTSWKSDMRPLSPLDVYPMVTDSVGNRKLKSKLPPSSLNKLSGIKAYMNFEKDLNRLIAPPEKKAKPNSLALKADLVTPSLSIYIARPTPSDDQTSLSDRPKYLFTPWHYSFSDLDLPENFNTNPSIGIPRKKL